MASGRSDAIKQQVGQAVLAALKSHVAPLLERLHVGFTLQIDEGHEVFDAKLSSLHPLFNRA